jgi:hypothetical protein
VDEGEVQVGARELDTYASVRERDTDLVLVMALRASAEIQRIFLEAVGWTETPLLNVSHSLSTRDGREVDVEAVFGDPNFRRILHIENKLDASFQQGQAASYAERIGELSLEKDVAAAASLLFCPSDYAAGRVHSEDFDALVTYEEVRDVLQTLGPWGREGALLVEHAILQHRRGGASSPDDPQRTRFFADLAAAAALNGLPALPPTPRKAQAGFMWYQRDVTLSQPNGWTPANASQGAWLVAKVVRGNVDIDLIGISKRLNPEDLRTAFTDTGFRFITTKSGVIIRAESEALDPDAPYEDQAQAGDAVIESLVALRSWWEEQGKRILEELLAAAPFPGLTDE